MIVAAHEVEQRIVQAGFLEVEIDGIDAVQRAEAAVAEAARGFAGRFGGRGNAELELLLAAFFKDAQDVARLTDGEARERIEEGSTPNFSVSSGVTGVGESRRSAVPSGA